jgi:hypothetical protein
MPPPHHLSRKIFELVDHVSSVLDVDPSFLVVGCTNSLVQFMHVKG